MQTRLYAHSQVLLLHIVQGVIMSDRIRPASTVVHGAAELPSVIVDSYNLELRDNDGFIGDRASKRAFVAIVEDWREKLRRIGDDPLGDEPTNEISKKKLDELVKSGESEAAGLVHGA